MDSKDIRGGAAWRWAPRAGQTVSDGASRPPTSGAFPATQDSALPQRLAGISILIVDDMPANADALRELLKLEGAEVQIAGDSHQALRRLMRERYDVVISDIAMPGMTGHEMVAAMRASGSNVGTPAIAYSGYGDPEAQRQAREAGFDVHLTKPAGLDSFVDAIRRVVPTRPIPDRQ